MQCIRRDLGGASEPCFPRFVVSFAPPSHTSAMPGLLSFPPFPEDVQTHPLLVIDYELILKHDEAEIDKLWKAATELGFW